jgi:hypothetical protein
MMHALAVTQEDRFAGCKIILADRGSDLRDGVGQPLKENGKTRDNNSGVCSVMERQSQKSETSTNCHNGVRARGELGTWAVTIDTAE